MNTILKIGYCHFLVKNPQQAAAAIKALAGMLQMDHKYVGGDLREVFWPKDRQDEIGFLTATPDQILPCEPGTEPIETASPRTLPRRTILRLTAGANNE
jgi:hypothetical protein